MCNANGPWTPGLPASLAMTRCGILPSGMHRPWAESDRKQRFRSSIPFRAGQPVPYLSSSLPFCVRFNAGLRRETSYTYAATLDTEPLARSYSGGIHTRSSSNHFQSARRVDWSLSSLGRGGSHCCHEFPRCGVSRLRPCSIERPTPLRTGRALLTHPAPNQHRSPCRGKIRSPQPTHYLISREPSQSSPRSGQGPATGAAAGKR